MGRTVFPISGSDPLPPPPDWQPIDWYHYLLPAMIHCGFCAIALLIFMVQTVRAVCKYGYGYDTALSSYCYLLGKRRQAASNKRRQAYGMKRRQAADKKRRQVASRKRRQAASRTGQEIDAEDIKETVETGDQLATGQEGSSEEDATAGNTNNLVIVDIE